MARLHSPVEVAAVGLYRWLQPVGRPPKRMTSVVEKATLLALANLAEHIIFQPWAGDQLTYGGRTFWVAALGEFQGACRGHIVLGAGTRDFLYRGHGHVTHTRFSGILCNCLQGVVPLAWAAYGIGRIEPGLQLVGRLLNSPPTAGGERNREERGKKADPLHRLTLFFGGAFGVAYWDALIITRIHNAVNPLPSGFRDHPRRIPAIAEGAEVAT